MKLLTFILLGSFTVISSAQAAKDFGRWVPMKHWERCERMMKKGKMFEVQNAEGNSIRTTCTPDRLPEKPIEWKSDAVRFRVVKAKPLRRSQDMPAESSVKQ